MISGLHICSPHAGVEADLCPLSYLRVWRRRTGRKNEVILILSHNLSTPPLYCTPTFHNHPPSTHYLILHPTSFLALFTYALLDTNKTMIPI
ncbi:hypothetical protein HBH70_224840 [Parastagonospora nodorum]|nr:hypothetical protein HBH51_224300 [Parastagonospora nodorum]KAH3996071.1 hypothetical protein HBI10_162260 [Parastagonospora nodorum]KAH4019578.1 hypothetical protein HBI13_126620 [Parastagonospora nodorum]KAH4019662.1 hypothetical protein HBI09_184080 [Parastagonospora nodorum]KAH4043949.1 hypothetical protein HBH49_223370 [Parastagonospora nodorum]